MKDKKHVIFDFDGTIADSLPLMVDIYNKHLASKYKLDKIVDPDFLRDIDLKSIIRMTHLPFYRLIFFIRKGRKLFEKERSRIRIFKGVRSAIKELSKEYDLGIVSSNSVDNIRFFLEKHGLLDNFSFIVSEKSLFGKHKALKKVMKRRSISPEDALYVGDEVRDITAARRAGLKVMCVTWGHNSEKRLREEKPDAIAKKPEDLSRIVKKFR